MRKIIFFLLLPLLLLTACGAVTSPPMLTVRSGEETIQARLGTYSWRWDNRDGTSTSVQADGHHPLAVADKLPILPLGESGEAELLFELAPMSISVRCWSAACAGDTKADYATLVCRDGAVALPTDGDYIVEVYARFEAGDAYYAFKTMGNA